MREGERKKNNNNFEFKEEKIAKPNPHPIHLAKKKSIKKPNSSYSYIIKINISSDAQIKGKKKPKLSHTIIDKKTYRELWNFNSFYFSFLRNQTLMRRAHQQQKQTNKKQHREGSNYGQ